MFRIMQLSDLHIKKSYQSSGLDKIFDEYCNPVKYLKEALEAAKDYKVDLIVLTGDLVHEGQVQDYDYLMSILDEYTSIPIIGVLGNHDKLDIIKSSNQLRESMKQLGTKDYYYQQGDIGFIGINSSVDGLVEGGFSKEQLEWLEECLDEVPGHIKTSIIICHHPIIWDHQAFFLKQELILRKILKKKNVKAVLCGHVHNGSVRSIDQCTLQISADSLLCGFNIKGNQLEYVQRIGFNIIEINEDIKIYPMYHEQNKEPFLVESGEKLSIKYCRKKKN